MISNKRRSTDFVNRRAKRKQAKLERSQGDEGVEEEKEEDGEEEKEIDEEEHELESFLFGRIADSALDDDEDAKSFLEGNFDNDEVEDDVSNLLSFEISTKPSGGDTVDFHVDTKGSTGQVCQFFCMLFENLIR